MGSDVTAADALTQRDDELGQYDVQWGIDVEGDSPEDAARRALTVQRNPESIATVFDVINKATGETTEIDLSAIDGHPDA